MVCNICERRCDIEENESGACGRYKSENGAMVECFANLYLVTAPISAETMPVLHFHPRAKFLQISTTGCNFSCEGCISTVVAKEMNEQSKALEHLTPLQIVQKALKLECDGIVFLMNDPLANFYTFLEVCKLAKENNLFTGCSTNAYFSAASLDLLSPYLDFVNIGIKGLSNDAYKSCGAYSYKPVLRNIELFYKKGVHIEIATIHKKGNEEEVVKIAEYIKALSSDIPFQLMRYLPIDNASIADEPSIIESEALCRTLMKTLPYVYLFNSPGSEYIHTYCPQCKTLLFERDFYGPMGSKLRKIHHFQDGHCTNCQCEISIEGTLAQKIFNEDGFEGGYPMTRALEIIEGSVVSLGVTQQSKIVQCWENILADKGLKKLHMDIQNFENYAKTIEYLAHMTDTQQRAKVLLSYMRDKIELIQEGIATKEDKPRVYYVMGKPLFALEDDRLENQLVELAGGISVNKLLNISGRPGRRISADILNILNPEFVFISSFLDYPVDAFYKECQKSRVNIDALKKRQVYNHLAPCFDFGSPRWILGLMHIANILHPELFHFDVYKEAEIFYKEFYHSEFVLGDVNRSFAKPYRYHKLISVPS